MRFILNFIFYGILFYLIYLAFPEAFFTMVSWVHSVVDFLYDIYMQLAAKVHEWRSNTNGASHPQQALFILSIGKAGFNL